jgi:hypothetical protein
MKFVMSRGIPLWLAFLAVACSSDSTAPDRQATEVAAVLPADGAVGVNPSAAIVLDFTQPMMAGMEQHIVLHEGGKDGPAVAGRWSWSADYRQLTFTPAGPLKPATRYTIHMGMDMDGAGGHDEHHTGTGGVHMGAGAGMMGGAGSMMGGTQGSMAECLMLSSFTTA